MINRSDVFLCLVGVDFGSSYPNSDQSIVQWEYETAAAREDMALLVFLNEEALRTPDGRLESIRRR